jgi:3-dehydroquinate synthase
MQKITIQGLQSDSQILIGEKLANANHYLPAGKVVIITDDNVRQYYHPVFPAGPVLRIGTREGIKNLDTVRKLYEGLLHLEADRSTFILAIGGGIVCDVAGFTASTYLRGVRFGFAATTLLAQVDASVGGKNGVNFGGYKNMVGVFSQPEFVICDLGFLQTLPKREILNGLAEIIKSALIKDQTLFEYLEKAFPKALELDLEVIEKLVHETVSIKARIVNQDEREGGERRLLNFGHTFGHALESTSGISHGEAVGIGMRMACSLSVQKGLLSPQKAGRIEKLLHNLGLPAAMPFDRQAVLVALKRDKKRADDKIHFILLKDIGQAMMELISIRELEEMLDK